jgi:guanylate kinase
LPSSDSPASEGGPAAGPLLIVISGPSGVGKDSVLERLRERGLPFHYTVTATTRPRREVKPEEHRFLRFLSEAEFDELLASDGLLEHAEVYGYHYGVPKAPLREALARGQDVIVRVDVQGAATIKRLVPPALLVFLAPPSVEELAERIHKRGLDDPEVVRRRLDKAAAELERQAAFDHVVVNENDRLDHTVDEVLAIIEEERRRPDREPVRL